MVGRSYLLVHTPDGYQILRYSSISLSLLLMSKHALDLRRRIFYCTFALDRVVSMSLGLAFSFTDDSAPNVLLPTLATDQESKSPSQLFLRSIRPSLFLFDIRRVQSAFYQKNSMVSTTTMDTSSGMRICFLDT